MQIGIVVCGDICARLGLRAGEQSLHEVKAFANMDNAQKAVPMSEQSLTMFMLRCVRAGSGSASHHEMETLAKFEIMDGAPVRGENIPIR